MRAPTASADNAVWRRAGVSHGKRSVPEEAAVAVSYDGGTYAVMMATPQDLDDFALGFSLTEGIVTGPADIRQLDVIEFRAGTELRMWLAEPRAKALTERRRHFAGPTGCGLCGIESLEEAVRSSPRVADEATFTPAQIMQVLDTLSPRQELNRQTRELQELYGAVWTTTVIASSGEITSAPSAASYAHMG